VERNRLKRRLREIVRLDILPRIPGAVDIVVRAGPRAYDASYDVLRAELTTGVRRLTGTAGDPP
jgi:ribonuclease P protein component